MSWRVAASLLVLRSEMDVLAPHRDKTSDGTIGDARHRANPASQHNPNARGVVCALDLTHDPAHGADMAKLFDHLRLSHPNPALWYVIFDRRIASATHGWESQPYYGASPHIEHLHVSVHGPYDDQTRWGVAAAFIGSGRLLRQGSTGADVAFIQRFLGISADGIFGPKTQIAIRRYQQVHGLDVDGIVGPRTWKSIRAELTK